MQVVICQHPRRKKGRRPLSRAARKRFHVELFFHHLKRFRALATRYERPPVTTCVVPPRLPPVWLSVGDGLGASHFCCAAYCPRLNDRSSARVREMSVDSSTTSSAPACTRSPFGNSTIRPEVRAVIRAA